MIQGLNAAVVPRFRIARPGSPNTHSPRRLCSSGSCDCPGRIARGRLPTTRMYSAIKALISGILIAAASTLARRYPGFGAARRLAAAVSVLGMIWLWSEQPDAENMAAHVGATFWYVLPSLPMFLLIPVLLRQGVRLLDVARGGLRHHRRAICDGHRHRPQARTAALSRRGRQASNARILARRADRLKCGLRSPLGSNSRHSDLHVSCRARTLPA